MQKNCVHGLPPSNRAACSGHKCQGGTISALTKDCMAGLCACVTCTQ
ncbi:hypothetical protein Z945_1695 [Sulfitobacter noctilucae]|nr:hypothetical protein Z945_1695 [Sulfitobacter noctilucae]